MTSSPYNTIYYKLKKNPPTTNKTKTPMDVDLDNMSQRPE